MYSKSKFFWHYIDLDFIHPVDLFKEGSQNMGVKKYFFMKTMSKLGGFLVYINFNVDLVNIYFVKKLT